MKSYIIVVEIAQLALMPEGTLFNFSGKKRQYKFIRDTGLEIEFSNVSGTKVYTTDFYAEFVDVKY
jgi:hypothetical protein